MLNEQTYEFGQAQLKLKDSIRFTLRESGSRIWYLVEDEITGRFFQIGLPQYTFLSTLDGKRTVDEVLMKTASLLRQDAIDQREAANICKWAIESGLVETELSNSANRRAEKDNAEVLQKSAQWLNPITFKIPLFNPDGLIEIAARYCGWVVSWGGMLLWLIVVAGGFFQLARHWSDFANQRVAAFSSDDFIWLAVTWLLLKLVHEFSHALVCKRFGGRVKSFGMLLLLMIPLPFVDVTSSWRFESKWPRILTAAAGMMAEVFVAAIAAMVWVSCTPGPMRYHAGNIIIAATLHTFLFNANPLMRFDGYYMLSDWLEIPNLYTHGRQYVKQLFKWIYFGNKGTPVGEVGFRALVVRVYGLMTMVWFVLIAVGLLLGAASMLEGVGLVVAVVGGCLWIGLPLFALVKYLTIGSLVEKPNRAHFAVAMSLTLAVVGGVLLACPSPSVVSAPVVIDYEPLSIIRSKAAGFATAIHVENGAQVTAGQLLMSLENPELVAELESLEIDIKISRLRCDTYLTSGDIASLNLEEESLEGMHRRHAELVQMVQDLKVCAITDGMVLARDLHTARGKYYQPGDEILSIGQSNQIQAIALGRQEDVDWIAANQTSHVDLCIWGRDRRQWISGQIDRVDPRARDELPHEAFAATVGGPLAVVSREQVESTDAGEEDSLMLTSPRVAIQIKLPAEEQQRLFAGQGGMMVVRARQQNLGTYLAFNFARFLRHNTLRTHGL